MEQLWEIDRALQHFFNADINSPLADRIFWLFTVIGLDQVLVPFVLILALFHRTRRCGLQTFLTYALAGVSAISVKYFCPRLRPGAALESSLLAPDEQVYLNSFPSGHAAIAFAIAFSLALCWPGNRRLVGAAAIGVAVLVGISRVYRGVHWPTDVAASAAIAILAALISRWLFSRGWAKVGPHPREELA
jgi:undecaprenyl-diphosphatase